MAFLAVFILPEILAIIGILAWLAWRIWRLPQRWVLVREHPLPREELGRFRLWRAAWFAAVPLAVTKSYTTEIYLLDPSEDERRLLPPRMWQHRLAIVAMVALLQSLTSASAQQLGGTYQPAPVGTEFYTGTTTRFTVVEHVPGGLVTNNASNLKATWSGGLTTRNIDAEAKARLAGLFPLAPGKEITFETASDKSRWRYRLTVQRAETVDVNGRKFDTFVVTQHEKGEPPNRFEGEYTMWFSPEHGFPLKMTYQHVSGDKPKGFSDWQVARIVPPGSPDGIWSFQISCSNSSYLRLPKVPVVDGVVLTNGATNPSSISLTNVGLRIIRKGDEIEFSGDSMNASGHAMTVSARGTLVGNTVNGSGVLNARSGCPFSAQRH